MPKISQRISTFSRSEIQTLWKAARKVASTSGATILAAPATEDFGRILRIVPRRVGPAVRRNLIRRWIRSIFYEDKLYEAKQDVIVIVRSDLATEPFEKFRKFLVNAIRPEQASGKRTSCSP